jgi:TRAP-type C4-dicarboxylate transport system substrate-binding protein
MERFRSLPPEQQNAVRENFHRFQSLPPEQRRNLRQRWQNASPAERQKMIARARAGRPPPMERRTN